MYDSIRPGKYWYDNNKKLIQAHGGSVIYAEGKYWWYGENKEGVTGRATGEECPYWHHGVKLYSSLDLYNWTDEGFVVRESDDKNNPFHGENLMDRPHVLFNAKTKKFVLWAKCVRGRDFNKCFFAVCIGDSLKNMNYVKDVTPEPHHVGDFDMFEHNGRAYVIYENPHKEMILRELNEDYTDVSDNWSSHIPMQGPPFTREAPAVFEKDGALYMIASGTTGYYANRTLAYDITALHGEWKELGEVCEGDFMKTSFNAQYSSVFLHKESGKLIAVGDRWLTDLSYDLPNMEDVFKQIYQDKKKLIVSDYSESNTSLATYVWLPVEIKKGKPTITWKSKYSL